MSLAVTLYIIVTVILFALNMIINILALGLSENKSIPTGTLIATVFAIVFVIWGTTILVVG
jgi:hypothetical protein